MPSLSPKLMILAAGLLGGCGVFLFLLAGLSWLGVGTDENTPTPSGLPVSAEDATSSPLSTQTASNSQATFPNIPQASPTPRDLATELAALQGVRTVRVVDVTPYDAGLSIFLEIDTFRGFDNADTAEAIRTLAFEIMPDDNTQFSVILWDHSRRATNFTWDRASQQWLSSPVMSNPG